MKNERPLPKEFLEFLLLKDQPLVDRFYELRSLIINLCSDCNELLYHTHALTSVYTISDKLKDGFCHIPIYTNHLNLGFNKGTLINDPNTLLKGTGKLIRHIPIDSQGKLNKKQLGELIKNAIAYAKSDMDKPSKVHSQTISKIKIGKK